MKRVANVSKETVHSDKEFNQGHTTEKYLHAIAEAYDLGWRPNSHIKYNLFDTGVGYQMNESDTCSEHEQLEENQPSAVTSILLAITFLLVGILSMTWWGMEW